MVRNPEQKEIKATTLDDPLGMDRQRKDLRSQPISKEYISKILQGELL